MYYFGYEYAMYFSNNTSFNSDISFWDTSNVTDMSYMFQSFPPSEEKHSFNQPLDNWNVSSVKNFESMFYNSNFNQNIGSWDTSSSTSLRAMFEYTNFNYDIGAWDTSNVTSMEYMFNGAQDFNQDLTGWCVSGITSEPADFATNSALTEANKPVWGTCPIGSVDTTPPSITLSGGTTAGSSTISLQVGDTFTDPGATATDDVDGDLTSSITTSGTVNTSNTGTYTISYNVSDAAGNTASVNRTVVVEAAASIYNGINQAINNGNIRFGQDSQNSINTSGNLLQPFYYSDLVRDWRQLTYTEPGPPQVAYPLVSKFGVGGDGTSNWNTNGTLAPNPIMANQVFDSSGFNNTGIIKVKGDITVGTAQLEVINSYSIGLGDNFVKITTTAKNIGDAAITNLRYWVGSKDDYVGGTDTPTIVRGNFVDGNFSTTVINHSKILSASYNYTR